MPICGHCAKADAKSRCSKCSSVSYCGRECQAAHWTAGHKKECKVLSAAAAKLGETQGGRVQTNLSDDGAEVVLVALRRGTVDDLEKWLDGGGDANLLISGTASSCAPSLLSCAVVTGTHREGGNTDAVSLLLRRGADPNAVDATGATALLAAVEQRNEGCVDALLAAGADPNRATTARRCSPLVMLCCDCLPPDPARPWGRDHEADARIASALLAAGADPEHVDGDGNCALVLAVCSGPSEEPPELRGPLLQALLQGGTDPDQVDSAESGRATALHYAVVYDDAAAVALLVAAGADPEKEAAAEGPFRGATPFRVAFDTRRLHLTRLLDPELPRDVPAGEEAQWYARRAAEEAAKALAGGADPGNVHHGLGELTLAEVAGGVLESE